MFTNTALIHIPTCNGLFLFCECWVSRADGGVYLFEWKSKKSNLNVVSYCAIFSLYKSIVLHVLRGYSLIVAHCSGVWQCVVWRMVYAWCMCGCGVVWCGVVWCGVVWCGVVWCGVVWCGVVWCGVVWWVWCGVVGVVWCGGVRWRGADRLGNTSSYVGLFLANSSNLPCAMISLSMSHVMTLSMYGGIVRSTMKFRVSY
jgi:hypothetical protein